MSREIVVVAPELVSGGVGDHTRLLLQNLPRIDGLRLVVPGIGSRPMSSFEQYPVEETEGTARDFGERLPKRGGKVFVQYSAYGFDRRGYPRWLIKALLEWKKTPETKLVIMFHEIWTFWPIWNKNYIWQQLHRRHLGRLLRVTDVALTSTPSQAEHLNALSPRRPVEVLPVGSNIHRVEGTEETREDGLAILFGSQSLRIGTLRKMHSALKTLGASRVIRKIITVGRGESREGNEEELRLLLELDLIDGFDQRGPLPEEKLSELLSICLFGISSQDDLSIMKSSTLMAYAAHGLNVISCHAARSKPEPLSLMIHPTELSQGLVQLELQGRGEKLRQWQERTSAWSRIANQVARTLEI